jgi:hypothetical protein
MTLTTLQADALYVITELVDRGDRPVTATIAAELDVTYDEADELMIELVTARLIDTDGFFF